jgi:lipocalin
VGTAFQTDPEGKPGELKVAFEGSQRMGDYWVLDLGPAIDGEYQYAIVSDSRSFFLFVLARDVDDFKATYDEEVKAKLDALDFKGFLQKPIPRYQEADCVYG